MIMGLWGARIAPPFSSLAFGPCPHDAGARRQARAVGVARVPRSCRHEGHGIRARETPRREGRGAHGPGPTAGRLGGAAC